MIKLFSFVAAITSGLFVGIHPVEMNVPAASVGASGSVGIQTSPSPTKTPVAAPSPTPTVKPTPTAAVSGNVAAQVTNTPAPTTQPSPTVQAEGEANGAITVELPASAVISSETTPTSVSVETDSGVSLFGSIHLGL